MSARVHAHVEGEANHVILQKLCAVEMWSLIGTWGLLIGYTGWSLSPRDPSVSTCPLQGLQGYVTQTTFLSGSEYLTRVFTLAW